jgi:hypothetical protein
LMSSLLATMACSSGPTPIPSNSISTQELSNSATPPFQTQNHNSIYKEPILHPESHWSYEGITGPKTWASLKEEYAQCGRGQRQSPINLVWSRPKKQGPITTLQLQLVSKTMAIQLSLTYPQAKRYLFVGKTMNCFNCIFTLPQNIHFRDAHSLWRFISCTKTLLGAWA